MSSEPQLFRVNPESQKSERIEEVDFAVLGLQEREDIQEWIAANPSILVDKRKNRKYSLGKPPLSGV